VLTLGHKIQVADADYPEELNWDDAMYVCSNFGDGWRLPTKEELTGMHEFLHKKVEGNFQHTGYWSSSEHEGYPSTAWGFYFDPAGAHSPYDNPKSIKNRVRAVRTLL